MSKERSRVSLRDWQEYIIWGEGVYDSHMTNHTFKTGVSGISRAFFLRVSKT